MSCPEGQRFNPQTKACQKFTLISKRSNSNLGNVKTEGVRLLNARFNKEKAAVEEALEADAASRNDKNFSKTA